MKNNDVINTLESLHKATYICTTCMPGSNGKTEIFFLNKKFGVIFSVDALTEERANQWYIGNPPEHGTADHHSFKMICDFAVALKLLRAINVYAAV